MMKLKKKKIIYTLTLFLLAFILYPTFKTQAASKKNWYKTVLNSKNGIYTLKKNGVKTKYDSADYPYYKLIDINQDGTKELLLSTTKDPWITYEDSVLLFTYYKKKVKLVAELGPFAGGGYLAYKNGILGVYERLSGYNWLTLYKLKNGKLKEQVRLDYFQPFHYDGNNKNSVYLKNNKQSTRKTYQKYLNKYFSKKAIIKYKKYTK